MTPLRRLVLLTTMLWADIEVAPAATRTWTGNSVNVMAVPHDNFWTNAFNWSGNAAPVAGDDLVFNGGIQGTSLNTFPAGTAFNSISVSSHVIAGGAAISLNAGLSGTGPQISLTSITLNANQTFTSTTAGGGILFTSQIITNGRTLTVDGSGNIVFTGAVSGSGGIIKNGSGTLQFAGNHTYTGDTVVNDGPVRIAGDHLGSRFISFSGPSALIAGGGTVKGMSASDPIDPGAANNGTGVIGSIGDVEITTEGALLIDIKGTTPGTQYDQLQVTGAVKIDNIPSVFGAGLLVTLVGFTPAPGDSFTIISNDGTDLVGSNLTGGGFFSNRPEGSTITVPNSNGGNTTFVITYRGGDGNDVVLHVAATRTWDGGGADNKWKTAANWVGDVAPAAGDDLIFPASAAQLGNVNDFPAGTLFNSIAFEGPGYFLSGAAISLRAGVVSNANINGPGNFVAVAFDSVALAADQSFVQNGSASMSVNSAIATNGRRLTFSGSGVPSPVGTVVGGAISGTGGVTIETGVFCRMDGTGSKTNTYTGATIITGGALVVRTQQPGSPLQMSGGTLFGQGQVGPMTATGGSIQPTDGVPRTIVVAGDLSLSAGSELAPELAGGITTAGQLSVNGQVSLGNPTLNLQDNTGSSNPPKVGDKFVIILNDGGDAVSGTFDSLPEGGTFVERGRLYSVTYKGGDGNDVVVELVAATVNTKPGNISTRLRVETGDNVLIGGFILTGPAFKRVLIRALGPSLPVGGALADPVLELRSSTGSLIRSNDSWKSTQRSQIEQTGIPPTNDLEAAIVATLDANNSAYTAIVRGVNDGTGVGLVEIYDLETNTDAKLANISTRGFVQTGDDVLIAGTIMVGPGTQKILVRAIGPSLPLAGKLADPTLELRDQNGALVQESDNWIDSPNKQAIIDTTIPPSNDLEAAILATVPANNASYTAIVRGVNNTTGIAVVEIYALN